MNFRKILVVSLFGLLLIQGAASAALKTGEPAPDFTLPDSYGENVTLSHFKGQFIVLEWVNPECPFVRKHYDTENMQTLQKEYTEKGVKWFSINSSAADQEGGYTPEEMNKFVKDSGASPSAVLMDPEGTVGHLYEAKTTPHMFIINPAGILIYQGAIDDIASVDPADVEKANNYVRMVLDVALEGQEEPTVSSTVSYGCTVKYK
jgi:peroxiredoxin